MTQPHITVVVGPDGETRHLVDKLSERICHGVGPKIDTQRVSHVETWNSLTQEAQDWITQRRPWEKYMLTADDFNTNWFWADMLPVSGPVLGPFQDHTHAIQAEIDWLSKKDLPIPSCLDSSK